MTLGDGIERKYVSKRDLLGALNFLADDCVLIPSGVGRFAVATLNDKKEPVVYAQLDFLPASLPNNKVLTLGRKERKGKQNER